MKLFMNCQFQELEESHQDEDKFPPLLTVVD